MSAIVPYLRKRDGVYQSERRVPLEARRHPDRYAIYFSSRPLFRCSLRTKDPVKAMTAFAEADIRFTNLVAQAGGKSAPSLVATSSNPTGRKLTDSDIDAIVERQRGLTAGPFEKAYLRADADSDQADELDRLIYELETDAESIRSALEARSLGEPDSPFDRPAEVADFIIRTRGFDAPIGSIDRGRIVGAVRRGMLLGYDLVSKLGSGEAMPRLPVRKPRTSDTPRGMTIREAVSAYREQKQLPAKTVSEANLSLLIFEKVVGNKPLGELTRSDFVAYVQHLSEQVVGGKTAGSVLRHLSPASITKRLGFLRSAIQQAIDRNSFEGINHASGIKVEAFARKVDRAKLPDKRRFTITELNRLFQHPWFTGCESATSIHKPGPHRLAGSEYWVPVVALMTGCRAGELGGLRVDEVRLNDPCPHLIIRPNQHRRTKTANASRLVPLLDTLMDLGFAAYVERMRKSGAERLFPDWLSPKKLKASGDAEAAWSNAKIIRAFNRTVLPAMLTDTFEQGTRQQLTFHSLRGAFKAMLGGAEYRLHPNIINDVVGHEKSELDRRYVGSLSIEETYPAIRGCMFKGLMLPAAP